MKVLLILENEPTAHSGIERHCRNIIDMYRNDSYVEISYLCKEQVCWHWNKWLKKVVFDYQQLKKIIAQSGCDVVHVHGFAQMPASQGLRAALSLGKKVVYTAHYHPFSTLNRSVLGWLYFQYFLRPHLSRISTIVAINNNDYHFFKRYNSNIVPIPNWITGIEHCPAERKKDMVLFVGRNHDNKGLHYLNLIPSDKYEVHCVTDSTRGLAEHIKVHLSVSDKELSVLYAQASLLVVPSRYEAFSYVALEALERGTPVLMSDGVRIADHLTGIEGWDVFERGNESDFLHKIDSTMSKTVDVESVTCRFAEKNIKPLFDKIYRA